MPIDLENRTAVITGAGRGIGRAIAEDLAEAGVAVGLVARSRGQLEDVVDTIRSRGGSAWAAPCDLRDPGAVEAAFESLVGHMGGCVHILVNNAARFLEKPVQEIGVAEFEDLLRTNLVAPMLCTQIVLRHMPAGGHIVNIASTAALRGYALQSAYCAAKHGLLGFTRSLAEELKPRGIRVSALCPGGVRTEFIAGSEVAARIEGQAILEPGDVADLVRFVLTRPANVDMGEVTLRRFH